MKFNVRSLVLVATLIAGCDLFQTREPEPPSQGTSCNLTPDDHEVVLKNLRCAMTERNVDNYVRCFVDTLLRPYVFESSPEEQLKFTQWNLESERRYFQNMLSTVNGTPALSDSLYNKIVTPGPPASAVYFLKYSLFIPHLDPRAPHLVRGNMELYFAEDSLHRWSIYRWVDKKISADSTWSYLKAWFNT